MALMAALAAFVAVASVMIWLANALRNPVETRLSGLTAKPIQRSLEAPLADRVFVPILDGVVHAFVRLLPHKLVAATNKQLLAAGSPLSPTGFYTVLFLCAVGFPLAIAFALADASGGITSRVLLATLAAGAIGLLLPFLWLRQRVRLRKTAIWRSLADAFDMVTVCVEAGLGLDAALRQVSNKLRGPLAEKFSHLAAGRRRPRPARGA